ncbi:MAG: dihydrofolate reductase family protein [Caldilineaceae bacterium]|nr:dihydrofolate reductase [Caldilineaceae bacterium]
MKTTVYIATSLDGFIARPNGDLDWLPGIGDADTGEDYGYQAFMDSVDVLVMGRGTYEIVCKFDPWPYGDKRVVVLSNTLTHLADDLPDTVELRTGTPVELVKALDQEGFRHAYIDGGKTIQGFLRARLIDELIITRIPVLIGAGIPLFGPLEEDVKLEHVQTRSYANGLVQSTYSVPGAHS